MRSVQEYYGSRESRKGYEFLLKGVKHFGYYPDKTNSISMRQAMVNMQEQLAKRLKLPQGARVLDAGCGEGATSFYLARKYKFRVVGIDVLAFNIAKGKAHKRPEDTVQFLVRDYNHSGFKSASFDAIFTLETLVHSPDYEATLEEFKRVLKPSGQLVMFEYSHTSYKKLPAKLVRDYRLMNKYAAMPAFDELEHGILRKSLIEIGFQKVTETDITEHMLPMLWRFRQLAFVPYQIVRLLRMQKQFVNTFAGWAGYKYRHIFRYNIYTARVPKR